MQAAALMLMEARPPYCKAEKTSSLFPVVVAAVTQMSLSVALVLLVVAAVVVVRVLPLPVVLASLAGALLEQLEVRGLLVAVVGPLVLPLGETVATALAAALLAHPLSMGVVVRLELLRLRLPILGLALRLVMTVQARLLQGRLVL